MLFFLFQTPDNNLDCMDIRDKVLTDRIINKPVLRHARQALQFRRCDRNCKMALPRSVIAAMSGMKVALVFNLQQTGLEKIRQALPQSLFFRHISHKLNISCV